MRESGSDKPPVTRVCCACAKGLTSSHSSDQEIVATMVQNIAAHLKSKLAHSLVKEIKEEQEGKVLQLSPSVGGMPMSLHVGTVATTSKIEPLTYNEAIKIASRAGLSGKQQTSVIADLRGKWWR